MQPPETRYVERPDGVSIAYQVVGEGPFDLLLAPGFVSHLELQWADPGYSEFLGRLASFSRLILYDKPGTGVSDPIPHVPAVEERSADIGHVLDAVGADQAALMGVSEGGPASVLYAATHPGRIRSLVLVGTFPRHDPDFPGTAEALERLGRVVEHWGDGSRLADIFFPSATVAQRRMYGSFQRAAASPRMAKAVLDALYGLDVTEALPLVGVPTLVVHRTGDRAIPVEAGRLLAELIPDARLAELPGEDHAPWFGDMESLVGEIEAFLTGTRRSRAPDRVLATVLFTDICGSTERAAKLGDAAWRELIERHDAIGARQVEAFGGRVVKSLGDGLLATFSGPAQAVRCARSLGEEVRALGIQLRAGVHTGEVEAIGTDVGGLAVHIGARISALAGAGEVLVSSTVRDLVVGSELWFAERGERELKGVPGTWRIFALGSERRTQPRETPLEPAREHMTLGDRAVVALARRAPRAMRAAARLSQRRPG